MSDEPDPDPRAAPAPLASAPLSAAAARAGRRWAWRAAGALTLIGAAACAALALYVAALARSTPGTGDLRPVQASWPSLIVSSDGATIGRFATAHVAPVKLKAVSPEVVKALIATEDRRFYAHSRFDLRRLLALAWYALNGDARDGATISLQYARRLLPQRSDTQTPLEHRLREAIIARRLERDRSKDEILEAYLNGAPFLYNVRGIEMAARTYFDKPAAQLDTAQSATLVGMLGSDQRSSPVRNPQRALERRNVVLSRMAEAGALAPARAAELQRLPLGLDFQRPAAEGVGPARHFVKQVRDQLLDWAEAHEADLYRDGLVIRTTLDTKLQRFAADALVQQVALLQRVAGFEWSEARPRTARIGQAAGQPFAYFWHDHAALLAEMARGTPAYRAAVQAGASEAQAQARVFNDGALMERLRAAKTRLTAGFVAIDPASGAVRAWVGSPDFDHEPFDHVAQARRQPGSTFKPFVYGAALRQGVSTERRYRDAPVNIVLSDGSHWQPTDAGGPSGKWLSLRQGLVQSKNTITAQVVQQVGATAVARFAKAAGVRDSRLEVVPSLALGTSAVSLLEMTGAYATLAAMGERRAPLLVTEISDHDGRVLARFDSPAERALDPAITARLVGMMRGVVEDPAERGTGVAVRTEFGVRGELAGKTGTTQNNTDGWFMLISP
ncbi:MAG: transglycosylase domain-containing protein, partial [Burkholderiaceae bacterium]